MSINRKRGSIALARSLCYQINGAADDSDDIDGGGYGSVDVAEILSAEVERLREALAQLEQEPVAWGVFEGNLHDMFFTQEEAQEMAALKGTHAEVRPLYTAPPAAQPEQEPVAYYHPRNGFYWAKPTSIFAPTVVDVPPMPLYAAAERNNG